VHFVPADGPAGRRDIVAIVEQDGLPSVRQTVASYEAPDPDDDFPDDVAARKRLGKLMRTVLAAHISPAIRRDLVFSLRVARRALRGPSPNRALACVRIDEFVGKVQNATGPAPGIPESEAKGWITTARDTEVLIGCG
jgi:hypothetical protein